MRDQDPVNDVDDGCSGLDVGLQDMGYDVGRGCKNIEIDATSPTTILRVVGDAVCPEGHVRVFFVQGGEVDSAKCSRADGRNLIRVQSLAHTDVIG